MVESPCLSKSALEGLPTWKIHDIRGTTSITPQGAVFAISIPDLLGLRLI